MLALLLVVAVASSIASAEQISFERAAGAANNMVPAGSAATDNPSAKVTEI
jgi:hypothetical protein